MIRSSTSAGREAWRNPDSRMPEGASGQVAHFPVRNRLFQLLADNQCSGGETPMRTLPERRSEVGHRTPRLSSSPARTKESEAVVSYPFPRMGDLIKRKFAPAL